MVQSTLLSQKRPGGKPVRSRRESRANCVTACENSQKNGCNNYCNHGRIKVSHTTGDTPQAITTDHVERHFHTNHKGARHGHQRTPLHGRSTSPPRSRTRRTATRPAPGAARTLNLPGGARIPPHHAHYQPTTARHGHHKTRGHPMSIFLWLILLLSGSAALIR